MSVVTYARDHAYRVFDTLQNFVSGLGTAKDPRVSSTFFFRELTKEQIESAYRSDWMARRLVDLPAEDATREWRSWQTDPNKIEKIEELEKRLDIQKKVRQALTRSRLYGGAALVIGVDQGEPEEELDLMAVGLNALKFVVVLTRWELMAGPRIYNVSSPWYTRPEYYTVATPMFGFHGEAGGAYPGSMTAPTNGATYGRDPAGRFGAAPLPADYGKPRNRPGGPDSDVNKQWVEPDYGMIRVHPSRVIEFSGNEIPDWRLVPMGGGWGDSILQTIDDTLRDFAMIVSGLASLVNDMKMDVVKIPELSNKLRTKELTAKLLERFTLSNQAKSSINTLLLDKEEEWNRIQTSFGSTPELIKVAMTLACAAGGVPESRIMGNSPNKGLAAQGASGGEVDIRNYYDDIASQQRSKYKPALTPLDVCLQASALGKYDKGIDYDWNPLYQPNPSEVAQVQLQKAQTTQVYMNLGLFNEDLLRDAVSSQISEDNVYPGWDDAVDEYGLEPEEPEAPPQQMLPTPPPGMVNKGQFEANPFHMLRAQAAQKAGLPIRVPPHPPRRAPIPAPQRDGLNDTGPPDEPRDLEGRWTTGDGGIVAYHGSPHDFDRFETSAIGTGEGAQAFGHGLYFAENEGVAKSYRAVHGRKWQISGEEIPSSWNQAQRSVVARIGEGEDREGIRRRSKLDFDAMSRREGGAQGEELDAIRRAKQKAADELVVLNAIGGRSVTEASGVIYQVRLHAKPEEFLDWDKPLSQQSDAVKTALGKIPWTSEYLKSDVFNGAQIVPHTVEGGQQFLAAGIRGIRYLDQGSRAAHEGTHNFVVFDPDDVEITHKNGMPMKRPTEDAEPVSREEFKRRWLELALESLPGRKHQPPGYRPPGSAVNQGRDAAAWDGEDDDPDGDA